MLGAIVSPPDAVAPLAIVRRLGLPRRLVVILEGEGLANDATALILYRFAVAAVSTGLFSLGRPPARSCSSLSAKSLTASASAGSLHLRRWAHDPRVEITLSLMTPYAAFLLPQQLGGSGVLATVAAGLYASWNGPLLIPAATRLQGIFFWDLLIYLLEGLIFLVTGMQTRTVFLRMHEVPWQHLVLAIALTVAVVIVARFLWVFPAVYVPRWLSPRCGGAIRRRPGNGSFSSLCRRARCCLIGGGARYSADDGRGAPFPSAIHSFCHLRHHRRHADRAGPVLPRVVRWLRLDARCRDERGREQEPRLRRGRKRSRCAHARLKQLRGRRPDLAGGARDPARAPRISRRKAAAAHGRRHGRGDEHDAAAPRADHGRARIHLRLLQRGAITDEGRRRIERELDLEEASIACKPEGGEEPPL